MADALKVSYLPYQVLALQLTHYRVGNNAVFATFCIYDRCVNRHLGIYVN